MRIKSIQYNKDGGLDIGAEILNEETSDYESKPLKKAKQAPLEGLAKSLQGLRGCALKMVEMSEVDQHIVKVEGIKIGYPKSGHMSISINLSRQLQYGDSHKLSTPTRPITAESDMDECLTAEEATLVDQILSMAEDYYNGQREAVTSPVWEKSEETRTAYAKGKIAYEKGGNIMDNPYDSEKDGDDAVESWNHGYLHAQTNSGEEGEDGEA